MRGAFEAVDVAPESEEISSVFKAFQLKGRFRYDQLDKLDNRAQDGGDFIPYRLKKDGTPYANSSEPISPNQFEQLLQDTEQTMVDQGNSIYSGQIDLHPIRQGAKTACDYCLYESFCRKDPEQMNWREV
jgi:ATP-dependent helicase/nuclease subunit B